MYGIKRPSSRIGMFIIEVMIVTIFKVGDVMFCCYY